MTGSRILTSWTWTGSGGGVPGRTPDPLKVRLRRPVTKVPRLRPLDLLDVTAREHRALHRALDRLVADGPRPGPADVAATALELLRHEAVERVVLYPLLERDDEGCPIVMERREEQQSITNLLARSLHPLQDADVPATLLELRVTVIGHTDREELEDFPRVRRHSSIEELRGLGRQRRELARRLAEQVTALPEELTSPEDDESPIARIERVARHVLERAEMPVARRR